MTQPKTQNRKTLIAVIALVLVAAIAAGVWYFTRPATVAGAKTVAVTVVKAEGDSKEHTLKTDSEYLGQALLDNKLAEGSQSEYGLFITTVDGTMADENQQQWWCVTKGGEAVNTGADVTPIADGDRFELTLKTGW